MQGAGVSDTSECWRREARHFMVLTRAGKPVYTRVGDPAALAAFAGLLAGLSAVANSIGEDAKGGGGERCDALRGFRSAAGVRVAFLERGPLLLFALDAGASRTGFDGETTGSLRVQLGHLHAQVVSLVLGSAGLGRAFAAAGAGLDCAGLLGGTQGVFHALLARTEAHPGAYAGAVPGVALPWALRRAALDAVAEAGRRRRGNVSSWPSLGLPWSPAAKAKVSEDSSEDDGEEEGEGEGSEGVIFACLIGGRDRLVACAARQGLGGGPLVHPDDYLLLSNLVGSSESVRSGGQASVVPLCLPRFHEAAFLHAYVTFLAPGLCLVLLGPSGAAGVFAAAARRVEGRLGEGGVLDLLARACAPFIAEDDDEDSLVPDRAAEGASPSAPPPPPSPPAESLSPPRTPFRVALAEVSPQGVASPALRDLRPVRKPPAPPSLLQFVLLRRPHERSPGEGGAGGAPRSQFVSTPFRAPAPPPAIRRHVLRAYKRMLVADSGGPRGAGALRDLATWMAVPVIDPHGGPGAPDVVVAPTSPPPLVSLRRDRDITLLAAFVPGTSRAAVEAAQADVLAWSAAASADLFFDPVPLP